MSQKALSAEKQSILKEFRTRVGELLDEQDRNDDDYLVHWLKRKNFNIQKAEKILRKALDWRRENLANLEKWDAPDVLKKYIPYGLTGVDNEGCPVYLLRVGNLDIKGVWKSAGKDAIFKYSLQEGEKQLADMKVQSAKQGHDVTRVSLIVDMDNFPIGCIKKPKYVSFALEMSKIAEEYYPNSYLKFVYIINNKPIYKAAIELAKSLAPEEVVAKWKIFSENEEKWKAALLQDIPSDQLPPYYGGTKKGSDEFCSDVICQGGKVPVELYLPKK